jgi:dTDP-4-amino-4,6-dideoxygalactose transaminase
MRSDILHPVVRQSDVETVADAARSPDRAMHYMEALRREVMALCEAPDCVLVANCTQALRVCLRLFAGPGAAVVPDLTFIATAHAALAAGVGVCLVDVDPDTLHLSRPGAVGWPDSAAAVVPVELLGRPISAELARNLEDYGAPIIVDAAQSLGATRWRPSYKAMCISFAANKIVHGHQGGAILGTREDCDRVRRYIRHGRSPASNSYHHEEAGENLGMNPLGAALSWSQLQRIHTITTRRYMQRDLYLRLGVLRDFGPYGNGWLHVGPRAVNRELPHCDLWEPLHMAPHIGGKIDFPAAMSAYRNLVALPSSDDLEVIGD